MDEKLNGQQGFVEQSVKDDAKKSVTIALSIGRDNVFTDEFKKYLREICTHALATAIMDVAKKHPDNFTDDKFVKETVQKAQADVLARVGLDLLRVLKYQMQHVFGEDGLSFVERAISIATGEAYDVRND